MSDPSLIIRRAVAEDAAEITRLINAFNVEDETDFHIFTEEQVREDGFGADPAFKVLLAEWQGKVSGYLLYLPSYDSIAGGRGYFMYDLYVVPEARSAGVGRKLVATLARLGEKINAASLAWGVFNGNARGIKFYESLEGKDSQALIMELHREPIAKLAKEGADLD
ncbi:N-acetyltransferase family protein [Rhodovibrionaceae bacterium A322]